MEQATGGISTLNDPKEAGTALLRQGKFDQAAAVLREAAAEMPNDEETFSLLGAALASKGDASAAADAFRRAVELAPSEARNHFNLGYAYQSVGRLPEAKRSLEQALSLNPGYEQARMRLAQVAQQLGASQPVVTPTPESAEGHTNIGGGGDTTGLLSSVGRQYAPPPAATEGHTNISGGGNASALLSIGNVMPAPTQEGHTNIGGGGGEANTAGLTLSSVGMGRAPVTETGHTNIGGGATAAAPPPRAAPGLRSAAPASVAPSSAAPASYAPPPSVAPPPGSPLLRNAPVPTLGMDYGVAENNSGMRDPNVPQEVARWNWAAFGFGFFDLGFLWSFNMRLPLIGAIQLLLIVIPFITGFSIGFAGPASIRANSGVLNVVSAISGLGLLGLAIYLGISGSSLAWQNRRFESVEDFKACQRTWGWWTLGLLIFSVILTIILVIVMVALLAAVSGGALGGPPAGGGRPF